MEPKSAPETATKESAFVESQLLVLEPSLVVPVLVLEPFLVVPVLSALELLVAGASFVAEDNPERKTLS